MTLRALTVHQPWASLIAAGVKRMENRGWRPRPAELSAGHWLAIHAGKYTTRGGAGLDHWHVAASVYAERRALIGPVPMLDAFEAIPPNERDGARGDAYVRGAVPYGAVIALVRFVGVCRASRDPWFGGPWGWVLSDATPLPEPFLCRGQQGLWTLDGDAIAAARAAYTARFRARHCIAENSPTITAPR